MEKITTTHNTGTSIKDVSESSSNSNDIKLGLYPETDEILISNMKATYTQKADSNDNNEFQELKIRTRNAGAENYFVIETERWSFDDLDEFIKILKDFKNRIK